MQVSRIWALLATCSALAGLTAAGFAWQEHTRTQAAIERLARALNEASSKERQVSSPSPPPTRIQVGPSSDELRLMLREELARAEPEVTDDAEEERAADDVRDPVESEAASQQARAIVERAVAARVWAERDAVEFRGVLPRLTADQVGAALERLIPAINRQEVRVAVESTPLF